VCVCPNALRAVPCLDAMLPTAGGCVDPAREALLPAIRTLADPALPCMFVYVCVCVCVCSCVRVCVCSPLGSGQFGNEPEFSYNEVSAPRGARAMHRPVSCVTHALCLMLLVQANTVNPAYFVLGGIMGCVPIAYWLVQSCQVRYGTQIMLHILSVSLYLQSVSAHAHQGQPTMRDSSWRWKGLARLSDVTSARC